MRELSIWNISLGRWRGVRVGIHALFFVLLVVVLHLSTNETREPWVAWGVAAVLILLLSVLLHETLHCVAAARLGGVQDQISAWPLGGFVQASVPHEPQYELMVALAGPLANSIVCLITAPALLLLDGNPVELLNLFALPKPSARIDAAAAVALVFWTNWLLFIVNLLPAPPLDGGRILKALLWPAFGSRAAAILVTRVAIVTAIALCVGAWFVRGPYPDAWLPMTLLGVFLLFCARHDSERLHEPDTDEGLFGYDFSQGYTSLNQAVESPRRNDRGPVRRWLEQRRLEKARRLREQEVAEDRRMDDILARIREHGIDSLSAEERAILNRVSERYRNRQQG